MKTTLTVVLLLSTYLLTAQQIKFTSDNFQGIEKNMINTNNYYLPIGNSEFLFAAGKANSDDVTLTKADKSCKTLWTVTGIKGYLAASILGKNILIFSAINSSRWSYYFIDAVHATLLDNATGKIIAEKDVPTYTKKAVTDVYVLNDSAANFKYLILRSTELEKVRMTSMFSIRKEFGRTNNLQAISLDNNLDISTNTLAIGDIQKAEFIGCTCINNDIVFASIQNNSINVCRYNAGASNIAATITAACDFENDVAKIDADISIHNNNIWLACKFDEAKKAASSLITGVFNFDNRKGIIQHDVMDKDYLKKYAEKISSLSITGTEFYDDKFIVIKEFSTFGTTASHTAYTAFGPVVISVYSSAMKLLKEVAADERVSVFYSIPSAYYKLIDNNLYVFYNSTKLSGIRSKYQVFNLDNFSLSDANEIKIDDAKLTMVLYSPGTVWFNHTALLPYAQQNNMLNPNKMVTKFKVADFK